MFIYLYFKVYFKVAEIYTFLYVAPVYHEENKQHFTVQNIIMFHGGIQGKQIDIFQNNFYSVNDYSDLKKQHVGHLLGGNVGYVMLISFYIMDDFIVFRLCSF